VTPTGNLKTWAQIFLKDNLGLDCKNRNCWISGNGVIVKVDEVKVVKKRRGNNEVEENLAGGCFYRK